MLKPDMLEYILTEYEKELDNQDAELTEEAKKLFESFVVFARIKLKSNPAVGMCVLEQGLGFKLADGIEVPLVNFPPANDPRNFVMPITKPNLHPSVSGITPTWSAPIFGVNQT